MSYQRAIYQKYNWPDHGSPSGYGALRLNASLVHFILAKESSIVVVVIVVGGLAGDPGPPVSEALRERSECLPELVTERLELTRHVGPFLLYSFTKGILKWRNQSV